MKTKIIIVTYECGKCGTKMKAKREIIIDKYLEKKLTIPTGRCACGSKDCGVLEDIEIVDKE